ncbi:MAG: hypothetical protein V1914_02935 [archaeon]
MTKKNIFEGVYIPTVEEVLERILNSDPCVVSVESDYLVLGNIRCVDSDGVEFEQYDRLRVNKDIERDADGSQVSFTPYNAVACLEKQKMFLPSMALSCNILACLYANRDDKEVNKVLMQYKDKGNGYGWHAQNTIVDWGSKKIIHYPSDKDFPEHGGSDGINNARRVERKFNPKDFMCMLLKEALKTPEFNNYIQNLTGLQKPKTLTEIGQYFQKPAKIWTSTNKEVRAVWLGCYNSDFDVSTNYDLYNFNACRGVQNL